MSYEFEERSLSSAFNNGFTGGSSSIAFSAGNSISGAISPNTARRATTQIAQDLLLAAGAGGSVSGGASAVGSGSAVGYGSTALISSASAGFGAGASVGSGTFLSDIEQAILRSTNPIDINESEEITVNGQRGIWANRAEVVNWRGSIPITEYQINVDSNPEIITKKSQQQLEYIQELAIRYLRPPTPPAPGEIIINQQANSVIPPAPPLVIRQQPARPETPEPLIIREAPPQPPAQVGRKVITISGKRIPPPPRKVVVERLAPLPAKPQSVIIERWLPYTQVKRKVIFQKSTERDPVIVKPRNIIVQWEAPSVSIKKEIKYLGVIKANPAEYVSRYGATLKQSSDLPGYVTEIKTPDGLVLAANYSNNSIYELEGDLQALKLVDLDREGLAEYKAYLQRLGISYDASAGSSTVSFGGVARASFDSGAVRGSFDAGAARGSFDARASIAPRASFDANAIRASFDASAPRASFDANAVRSSFDAGSARGSFDARASIAPRASFDANAVRASFDASAPRASFDGSIAPRASFDANAVRASFDASAPRASFDASIAPRASFDASAVRGSVGGASSFGAGSARASVSSASGLADQILNSLDKNSDNKISASEAESALLRLNSRLGRNYGEDEVRSFLSSLDTNRDGFIDAEEFRRSFFNFIGSF